LEHKAGLQAEVKGIRKIPGFSAAHKYVFNLPFTQEQIIYGTQSQLSTRKPRGTRQSPQSKGVPPASLQGVFCRSNPLNRRPIPCFKWLSGTDPFAQMGIATLFRDHSSTARNDTCRGARRILAKFRSLIYGTSSHNTAGSRGGKFTPVIELLIELLKKNKKATPSNIKGAKYLLEFFQPSLPEF